MFIWLRVYKTGNSKFIGQNILRVIFAEDAVGLLPLVLDLKFYCSLYPAFHRFPIAALLWSKKRSLNIAET